MRSIFGKPLWVYVSIGLALYFVYDLVTSRMRKIDIDENMAIACATVVSHERSGHSGTVTRYEYWVDGRAYVSMSNDDKRFGNCIQSKSCIGLKFTVEYSSVNPSNSRILWSKPDCPAQ